MCRKKQELPDMTEAKAEKAKTKPKTDKTDAAAARDQRRADRLSRRPKRSEVPDESKLKILVEKNPRREGTEPHAHFEKYRDGMTVGELLGEGIGGSWVHLQADIERGYVATAA
jgi:hypothetical protein